MDSIHNLFPAQIDSFEHGLKYLGYYIKANCYYVSDWQWLIRKVDNKIRTWSNRFLSLGGRLTLLASVLSAILVYWFSLAQVPVTITEILRKMIWKIFYGVRVRNTRNIILLVGRISSPLRVAGVGVSDNLISLTLHCLSRMHGVH